MWNASIRALNTFLLTLLVADECRLWIRTIFIENDMTLRLFCVALCTSLVLVYGCSSSNPTDPDANKDPDVQSLSPIDFLWAGSVGTVYQFNESGFSTDTNGVTTPMTAKSISLTIKKPVYELNPSTKAVCYGIGDDSKYLVANAARLWYGDSVGAKIYGVFAQKPFVLGSLFPSWKYDSTTKDARFVALNQIKTFGGQRYVTLCTVRTSIVEGGGMSVVTDDSVWLSPGFGVVEESVMTTRSYTGGKTSVIYDCIELNSVTKP